MANDDFKLVLWSDGESVRDDDLSNAGKHSLARLLDGMIEKVLPGAERGDVTGGTDVLFTGTNGNNAPTNKWCYALASGGAYPRKGTANTKIQIAPGTLLQKVAARDGNEATLLSYTFSGTEEVTIANGDATNPRVDLVQMKLEWESGNLVSRDFEDAITGALTSTNTNKHRRVKCTLLVKQGTPAATPAYPEPDAGYVVIAGIFVPQTWTGVAAPITVDTASTQPLVIHDQRMPVGTPRPYHCFAPRDWIGQQDGSHWSPSAFGTGMTAAVNTAGEAWAPLRTGSGGGVSLDTGRASGIGRLISVEVANWLSSGGTTPPYLARWENAAGTSATANLNSLANIVSATAKAMTQDRRSFESSHAPFAGPTILPNSLEMGPPVWANGRRGISPADGSVSAGQWEALIVKWPAPNAASTMQLFRATFFVAEGL